MGDNQLPFPDEPIAVFASLFFNPLQGWTLSVRSRQSFQTWSDGTMERYESLTTGEAMQVLEAVMGDQAAMPGPESSSTVSPPET